MGRKSLETSVSKFCHHFKANFLIGQVYKIWREFERSGASLDSKSLSLGAACLRKWFCHRGKLFNVKIEIIKKQPIN